MHDALSNHGFAARLENESPTAPHRNVLPPAALKNGRSAVSHATRLGSPAMKTQVDLRARVRELMPTVRRDLETLVRIPSISHPGHDPRELRRSAEATATILGVAGCETRLLEIEGAPPAVLGRIRAPAGAPHVLLYAHHHVQPTCARTPWRSGPFEPIQTDGRPYGRGFLLAQTGAVRRAAT